MREAFHIGIVASLLLTLVQSPLSHTHDKGLHRDHTPEFIHAHWPVDPGPSEIPSLRAPDPGADARPLDWFASDGKAPLKFALTQFLPLPSLPTQTAEAAQALSHEPDPPWRISLQPRAPPA